MSAKTWSLLPIDFQDPSVQISAADIKIDGNLLGEGAHSKVYQAKYFGNDCVVKELNIPALDFTPEDIQVLRREVEIHM